MASAKRKRHQQRQRRRQTGSGGEGDNGVSKDGGRASADGGISINIRSFAASEAYQHMKKKMLSAGSRGPPLSNQAQTKIGWGGGQQINAYACGHRNIKGEMKEWAGMYPGGANQWRMRRRLAGNIEENNGSVISVQVAGVVAGVEGMLDGGRWKRQTVAGM